MYRIVVIYHFFSASILQMQDAMNAMERRIWQMVSNSTVNPADWCSEDAEEHHEHFSPPLPSPCSFSPAQSFISSPTPELPDVFHSYPPSIPGPSWASGLTLTGLPQTGPHLSPGPPPQTRPRLPPPSPTRHKLRQPEEVLDQLSDWVVPGRVGRLAIKLAKECVLGLM